MQAKGLTLYVRPIDLSTIFCATRLLVSLARRWLGGRSRLAARRQTLAGRFAAPRYFKSLRLGLGRQGPLGRLSFYWLRKVKRELGKILTLKFNGKCEGSEWAGLRLSFSLGKVHLKL